MREDKGVGKVGENECIFWVGGIKKKEWLWFFETGSLVWFGCMWVHVLLFLISIELLVHWCDLGKGAGRPFWFFFQYRRRYVFSALRVFEAVFPLSQHGFRSYICFIYPIGQPILKSKRVVMRLVFWFRFLFSRAWFGPSYVVHSCKIIPFGLAILRNLELIGMFFTGPHGAVQWLLLLFFFFLISNKMVDLVEEKRPFLAKLNRLFEVEVRRSTKQYTFNSKHLRIWHIANSFPFAFFHKLPPTSTYLNS